MALKMKQFFSRIFKDVGTLNKGMEKNSGSDDHLKWQSSVIGSYAQWQVQELP